MESLKWLCEKELVRIYGYVIMPNHIHLMWKQLKMNGKEFPKNSFEKFTAHRFRKKLVGESPETVKRFMVDASDRKYNFWQRDPLAVLIFSREMASQKLDYMHFNPLRNIGSFVSCLKNTAFHPHLFTKMVRMNLEY